MKKFFFNIILVCITLLTYNVGCSQQNEKLSNNKRIEIPEELLMFIKQKLPYYHIPNINEYIKEWSIFYNYNYLQIPYFVKGDFNGDKYEDYALLLLDTLNQLSLFAFNKKIDSDYSEFYIKNIGYNEKIDVGLNIYIKGEKLEGIDGKILLHRDAFIVNIFETSSQLYYWENGEYKEFWLSD